jgi:5-methylcytosine-specific restriction protein B
VLSERLREVHALLAIHAFEFGHRVFYEAIRFAALYEQCGDSELATILDRILVQKVLPRLHGSRRRLEQLLLGLSSYCVALSPPATDDEVTRFDPDRYSLEQVVLPQSFSKLRRMLRSLQANQFASFSE